MNARWIMLNLPTACFHFLWAGIAKHGQTGGILPSQRFLIAKMIAPIPEDYHGQIIELGAGSGALTLRLAGRCPAARILACEINPTLAQDNRENLAKAGVDGRVKVVADSAEHLLSEVGCVGAEKPDFVISGVPLGNLGGKKTRAFIRTVSQTLADGGMYIQFQHSLLDRKKIRASFPNTLTVPVFMNLPPAVVYYARRQEVSPSAFAGKMELSQRSHYSLGVTRRA
jgi:phosphatidylethanolamine/phosphatidyl-N-methylethanolamine N-methyltransferase